MDRVGTGIKRRHKRIGWLLAALVAFASGSQPARQLAAFPAEVTLTEGYGARIAMSVPCVLSGNGADVAACSSAAGGGGLEINANSEGEAVFTLRLFDILPIRRMRVFVAPEIRLVPGGDSIGVALRMEGVLLVGTSDVGAAESPARAAGLRSGDSILAVNGTAVSNAQTLLALIEASDGRAVSIACERDGEPFAVRVVPRRDPRDGVYRIGVWVRDSTAGVGTLSFIDPETGRFGALGHAIADADTQTLLSLSEGYIYDSVVADVRRGAPGAPGELIGSFFASPSPQGEIVINTHMGIYGRYTAELAREAVPVCTRDEARLGPAVLLSEVDGEGVQEYSCEITRLNPQSASAQRGMVVRVTDEKLLARTGGIVQGMSGSPILQNGRLVGAVTHVFVNDPAQGYGMYIEWMLEAAGAIADAA